MGLEQYYDKFVEDGFDDLESVAAVKECDLIELGVLRGHRRKILNRQQRRFSSQKRSLQQGKARACVVAVQWYRYLLVEDAKLEVKKWLESAGCVQYWATFLGEGFDDMETLRLVSEEDMSSMKIKRGHMRKILNRLNPDASASSPASDSGLILSPWLYHFL